MIKVCHGDRLPHVRCGIWHHYGADILARLETSEQFDVCVCVCVCLLTEYVFESEDARQKDAPGDEQLV